MLLITDLLKKINSITDGQWNLSNQIRFSQAEMPVIVWNINELCNMHCPHCYANAKNKKNLSYEISTNEAKVILQKLKEANVKIIIFSGGEPLLRKDIFELLFFSKNLGFYSNLSTNGILINEVTAKKLYEIKIDYVGISIDGLPEFNDSYRGISGAFERAIKGIKNLKNVGIKTGIRMTLTRKNKDHLFPLIQIADELDVDRFYISHLLYSGRGKDIQKDDIEKDTIRSLMYQIFEITENFIKLNKKIQFVSGGNDVDGALLYLYILEKYGKEKAQRLWNILLQKKGNSAGERILNIDNYGEVHPDQFWRKYSAGNILKKSLKDILNDPLLIQLKEREKYLKDCKDCYFLKICRGSHRERALAVYNDLWAMDPACYLNNSEKLYKHKQGEAYEI